MKSVTEMIREFFKGVGFGMGKIRIPDFELPDSGGLMSAIEEQQQIVEARMRLLELRQQVMTGVDEECPK